MNQLVVATEPPQVPGPPAIDTSNQYLLQTWSHVACPELAVLLIRLKIAAEVHQSHHWTSRGDSFYGDHLMFERMYKQIVDEIDSVAERAVGIGGDENVNVAKIAHHVAQGVQLFAAPTSTLPASALLAHRSVTVEADLLVTIEGLIHSLRARGIMTRGIQNLLEDIASAHETHVYMLQRKMNSGT